MLVGIVGAGVSGLVTARILRDTGMDVVVWEKAPDVGGVWSDTRRYPGVSTQDDRDSYSFSDAPMPADFPLHPTGADVRHYLEGYAEQHGLTSTLRLSTEVVTAERTLTGGWRVGTVGPDGVALTHVDWLVLANGVYSTPHVPDWPGAEDFRAAGGRVVVPTALGDGETLADQHVVVVGWGKTACDVATVSAGLATSTTVVARRVSWKLPKRLTAGLGWKDLMLTRLGEYVMDGRPAPTGPAGRLTDAVGRVLSRRVTAALGASVAGQLNLDALGLRPDVPLPVCDSLVTEGFFEAVAEHRLQVLRERSVVALTTLGGRPAVRLSDGSVQRADVVVPATGFEQTVAFLEPAVRARLLTPEGDLHLHRRVVPHHVPRLAFAGWGNTYRSPLRAEIGAIWLASWILGDMVVPSRSERIATQETFHLSHRRAAEAGSAQLPSGSFADLDRLCADLRLPLPAATRRRQRLRPLSPSDYAYLLPALQRRLQAGAMPTPPVVRVAPMASVDVPGTVAAAAVVDVPNTVAGAPVRPVARVSGRSSARAARSRRRARAAKAAARR